MTDHAPDLIPVLALRPKDAARALGIGQRKPWEIGLSPDRKAPMTDRRALKLSEVHDGAPCYVPGVGEVTVGDVRASFGPCVEWEDRFIRMWCWQVTHPYEEPCLADYGLVKGEGPPSVRRRNAGRRAQ